MSLMHFYFMDDIDPPTEEMLEKAFHFRRLRLFIWCFRQAHGIHSSQGHILKLILMSFLFDRGWKEFYKLALEHRELVRKKVEQAIEKHNRKTKKETVTAWRVSTLNFITC